MKQKLFTFFLALVTGTIAFAHDAEIGNIYYLLDSDTKTATVTYRGNRYDSYSNEYYGTVVIPSSVTYYGITYSVTSIGKYAFYNCSSLTSVTIGESVTSIGDDAFSGCRELTSVTISESVTSIGEWAFSGCWELTSVTISESVTSIGEWAFASCSSLTSVTIGESVTSIGDDAFSGCSSLTSVTIKSDAIVNKRYYTYSNLSHIFGSQVTEYVIGDNVKGIGKYAFSGCSSLTSITIPNSVTSIGNIAFSYCSSLTSVTIPNSVTSIGYSAFYGCSSIASPVYNAHCFAYMPTSYSGAYTIPEGIEQIAGGAFDGCSSLTSVTIPNSVTSIGYSAFEGCSSLTSITIPESMTSIGDGAFRGCSSLTSVTIPNSVTSIGYSAFEGCSSLTSITIPESMTSIGDGAFRGCSSLTSITIPNSVTSIGESTFSDCSSLTSVTIGNGVTSIGESTFSGCSSLTSVTIGNGVTSIGESTFYECSSLPSVTIPNSITSIGNYAFYGCSSLTKTNYTGDIAGWCNIRFGFYANPMNYSHNFYINDQEIKDLVIPNSVDSIHYYAFYRCSSLTSVTCEAETPPTVGQYAFDGVSKSIPVYVPCGCVETYKAASGWSDFTNIQVPLLEYSIEVYVNDSIMGTAKVDYNTFCEGAQISATPNIGCYFVQWSDGNTENPRTLELTQDTTLIAEFAQSFSGQCGDSLYWELVDDTLHITGSGEMYNYNPDTAPWKLLVGSIKVLTIAEDVTKLSLSFGSCSVLESVVWNARHAADAYSDGQSVYPIFYDIRSHITSFTFGEAVEYIPTYLCDGCYKLTSVTIPNSVTSIGRSAFSGCSSLTSITIPNSVTSIGVGAFSGCSSLTSMTIGESVTSIGNSAFNQCTSLTSVTIPNSVTSIGNYAFYECYSLTSVTIPNSVTSIGNSAFRDCLFLTSVHITDLAAWCNIDFLDFRANPLYIAHNLYLNGELVKDLVIPNGVTSIGNYAFYDCSSLTSVTIPNSVTSIGNSAFDGRTSLTSITCEAENPPTVGSDAFYNVSKSIPVYVPCGCVGAYKAKRGWADFTNIREPLAEYSIEVYVNDFEDGYAKVDKNNACGSQISATPNFGYHFVQWSDRNTENPRTLELTQDTILIAEFAPNTYTITTVSSDTQRGTTQGDTTVNYLEYITISASASYGYHFVQWNDGNSDNPRQVQVTGNTTYTATFDKNTYAISLSCNEEQGSVEGVTSAKYLDTVTISATPNIGYHFVQWSDGNTDAIRTLELTQDTTLIAEFAQSFSGQCGDSLYWELIDTTLQITGKGEMYDYKPDSAPWKLLVSSIKVLTIVEDVTKLSQSFDSCSVLESIVWNAKNCADASSLETAPFYAIRSQITSFTFGENVEHIPAYLCAGMDELTSVTIPNSVTSIGSSAFYNCTSLTSVTIPESVTSIGKSAFEGCASLTSITIPNSVTSIGRSAFYGCDNITSVTWNAKNCNTYNFGSQVTSFEFGNEVEVVPSSLCKGMEKLTSVTIPESVTSIGSSAFEGCASLTSVTIPESVTSIGSSAFEGCASLTSITIPESVTSIGSSAFYNCSSLTSITIPNSVTSIGDEAFYGCDNITSVTWNAKNCNTYNFGSQVTSFEFGNEVEVVPSSLCKGMEKLTSVTIPNSVKTIGTSAFEGCVRLGKISLGTGLEEIATNAFAGCTRLYDIYVHATYPPFAEWSSFANYNVYVYVPCEYLRDYTLDIVWGIFRFIECIDSEDATTDGNVTVVPGYNDVTITWPTAENADTYSLVINKDNQPFCTLTFNQEGQLLNIAFAPSRDGNNRPAQYAEQAVNGYRFTVTGLTEATQYAYNITTKDAANKTIATYSGEFTTMGDTTTDMDNI